MLKLLLESLLRSVGPAAAAAAGGEGAVRVVDSLSLSLAEAMAASDCLREAVGLLPGGRGRGLSMASSCFAQG